MLIETLGFFISFSKEVSLELTPDAVDVGLGRLQFFWIVLERFEEELVRIAGLDAVAS